LLAGGGDFRSIFSTVWDIHNIIQKDPLKESAIHPKVYILANDQHPNCIAKFIFHLALLDELSAFEDETDLHTLPDAALIAATLMYSFAAPVCPRCAHDKQMQVIARLRTLSASDVSREYARVDACTWGKVRRVYAFWSSDAARRQGSVGAALDTVTACVPPHPEVDRIMEPKRAEASLRKEAELRAHFDGLDDCAFRALADESSSVVPAGTPRREATALLTATAMDMLADGHDLALRLGILGEAKEYYARKFLLLPAALAAREAALVYPDNVDKRARYEKILSRTRERGQRAGETPPFGGPPGLGRARERLREAFDMYEVVVRRYWDPTVTSLQERLGGDPLVPSPPPHSLPGPPASGAPPNPTPAYAPLFPHRLLP
jgi:hypothetical protein